MTVRIRALGINHDGVATDHGDQHVALDAPRTQPADTDHHFGLVGDTKGRLRAAPHGAGVSVPASGSRRVVALSSNLIETVDYLDVPPTKAAGVLRGIGLHGLDRSDAAAEESPTTGHLR